MSQPVTHVLEPDQELPVSNFSLMSVQITPDSGTYVAEASNDGNTWIDVGGGNITANTLLTTEDPTNPLPRAMKLFRVRESVAGTDPAITLQAHDAA